ncbi:SH3 domain-containing protein [Halanaerobium salsuginis]|uniref:NlpC/P60 family protein n=1 Tax=Halanaerobium salsuginis TaxID=29563 RepID=A0A1I4IVA0_9FIRM|nr:SH3 domain-containing protein [Halanaerobium salsuginis]SFL58234.1 NlpC/P60 family protein [Halanaerobium salsuginis]
MNKFIVNRAPGITAAMNKAKFWLTENEQEVLLSPVQIRNYNHLTLSRAAQLGKQNKFCDLSEYPAVLTAAELRKKLLTVSNPDYLRLHNFYHPCYQSSAQLAATELSPTVKELLIEELYLESLAGNSERKFSVCFAVLVSRSNLRAYPTDKSYTRSRDSLEQDMFQLTALSPGTPVAVLYYSKNDNWAFIQSKYYCGWLEKEKLAFSKTKAAALAYLDSKDFLVITGSHLQTEPYPASYHKTGLSFQMGDKIPLLTAEWEPLIKADFPDLSQALSAYQVVLPARDSQGQLYFERGIVAQSNDFNCGYLEYNRANLVKQAFKVLGERYGWGGIFKRRDCSRFLVDIYRSVGIELPRDTGLAQEKIPAAKDIILQGSAAERKQQLTLLAAGDPLYMKGHVMLYLGEHNDHHYVIHAAAGYSELVNDSLTEINVRAVFVMELEQFLKNKEQSYLDAIYLGRQFLLTQS